MRWRCRVLAGLGLAVAALAVAASDARGETKMAIEIPPAKDVLARLVKEHPRILVRAADFERARKHVEETSHGKRWYVSLRNEAGKMLAAPPSTYEIPDGKRLLATSRRVLDRVTTLGLVYRLTGEAKYADRAWKELEAAAAFKDWNPPHFLDTAEMTCAFGIAYDWLHDRWSPEQRKVLRTAIVELGLKPGLACWEGRGASNWWPRCSHNWNQVCSGGLAVGALAIADDEPDLAGDVLVRALASIRLPMAEFAPDGAWAEGPGYWDYATKYNVFMLAALESALGTDFGLSAAKGFDETGAFPIYLTSPLGETFNFADVGRPHRIRAPQMFWLASKFNRLWYAEWQYGRAAPDPLDLLWLPEPVRYELLPLPLARYFRGCEVVTMRTAWYERSAAFVGLKAGSNAVNHSHLDLGSFVFEAQGQRWAIDLGSDNYNLPRYFSPDTRWTYYRLRAEGHNTLVINPDAEPDQDPKAATKIIRFETGPEQTVAAADLTAAYARHADKVVRTMEFTPAGGLRVTDEVELKAPGDIWWFMHTTAEVTAGDGKSAAVLALGGKTLAVRIAEPAGARFTVMDAAPLDASPKPEGQADNKGVRKLAVHLAKAEKTRLVVELAAPAAAEPVQPVPLPRPNE